MAKKKSDDAERDEADEQLESGAVPGAPAEPSDSTAGALQPTSGDKDKIEGKGPGLPYPDVSQPDAAVRYGNDEASRLADKYPNPGTLIAALRKQAKETHGLSADKDFMLEVAARLEAEFVRTRRAFP